MIFYFLFIQRYIFKYLDDDVSRGRNKRSVTDELDLLFPQFTGNVQIIMDMYKWKNKANQVRRIVE